MIRSFRYRIYPTKRQHKVLNEHLALCCELYNAALQERREAWARERKPIRYYDQTYQLAEIRKLRPDLSAVHSQVLELVLKRVDLAFKAFFRRRAKKGERVGYPRFCSPYRYNSLSFRQSAARYLVNNKLRLSKIGEVRIKMHRPLPLASVKTLIVKREAGRWFAVFTAECDPEPIAFSFRSIGIDVGINKFATLSDGTAINNPRWYRKAERGLRVAQRRVARRKKVSNRRRKAVTMLQRTHARIRQQRADFQHKLSRRLVNENGLIAVEDLNIKGLAGGMLAKSVHDAGWSNFLFMLAYKAESAGRVLVKVDPRGTSQICTCGALVRKTLRDRVHVCLSCGLVADRDHVSAQVILARGEPSSANVGAVMPCVA